LKASPLAHSSNFATSTTLSTAASYSTNSGSSYEDSTEKVLFEHSSGAATLTTKWALKYDLPFPLLSDPESVIHKKYGAWGEKNMYGKMVMGVIRSTFLIDENGKIAKIYSKVKAKGHAMRVLEDI